MTRGRAWLDRLIAWSPVFLLGAFTALTYWLNAQVQPGGAAFDLLTRGEGRKALDIGRPSPCDDRQQEPKNAMHNFSGRF